MGVFTSLVWLPLAWAGTITASQWGEFTFLTAAAWVVAESYRDAGWLLAHAQRHVAPSLGGEP